MKNQRHKLDFGHAYGTLKSITHTLAFTGMLGLVALPVNAQATAQDFADERNQRIINDCERSGGTWSGSYTSGRCVDASTSGGGGGLVGNAFGVWLIWCLATNCMEGSE